MRQEERSALAAIVASGIVTYRRPTNPTGFKQVADDALAVADAILNKTEADEKANNPRK